MSQCPHCHGELTPDPSNPQKLLCYNCKKRYDASAVEGYWAGQAQQNQTMPQTQPYDPYAGTAQQQPTMQQPYAPQPAPVTPDPYAAQQPQMPQQAAMGAAGYPGAQQPAYMQPQKPGKGLAITSLVLGILSVLGAIIPFANVFAIVLAVVALILGIVAAVKASKGTGGGMGFGIAGIICGILGIIVAVAINIFAIDVLDTAAQNLNMNNFNELVQNIENENLNLENENEINEYINTLTNGNANTNTNANENMNTNVNTNTQVTPPAVTPNGNVSANWMDGQISVDGYVITLGQTTLKDLEANTKLYLDLAAAGYANGYVVNPGSSISTISLDYQGAESLSCYISVGNVTNEVKDITECVITTFDIDKPYRASDPTPQVTAPGGITFGSTKTDVIALYGEPKDKTESGDYATFNYDDGNYNKYIEFSFDNTGCSGIRMRTYL